MRVNNFHGHLVLASGGRKARPYEDFHSTFEGLLWTDPDKGGSRSALGRAETGQTAGSPSADSIWISELSFAAQAQHLVRSQFDGPEPWRLVGSLSLYFIILLHGLPPLNACFQ